MNQHDEEVFKMMDVGEFAELNDFLGEFLCNPTDEFIHQPMATTSAAAPTLAFNTSSPVSPDISTQTYQAGAAAAAPPSVPSMQLQVEDPTARVSPTPSVSGGESSSSNSSRTDADEDYSFAPPSTAVPAVVTTSSGIHDAHVKNQQAATKPTPSAPSAEDKKNRRR
jgi:hypothetical protein